MVDLWRPRSFVLELRIGVGGAWVDVTADLDESALSWQWGSTDRFGQAQPSVLSFQLQDMDPAAPGKYNPDNPAGPYFGRLVEGVAARWTVSAYVPPVDNVVQERRVFGSVTALRSLWLDDDSAHGRTAVTVTDVLGDWGRKQLRDLLTEQTIRDGAVAFWALSDADGARGAAESSPFTQAAMQVTGDPKQIGWGGGNGTNNDGAASVMFNGDPEGTASGLVGAVQWPAGASDNYLLECWISLSPDNLPPDGTHAVLLDISDGPEDSPSLRVVVNYLGKLILTAATSTGRVVADGHLHHVVVERYAGPTYALYVDGTYVHSVAAGAHPLRGLTVGCESPYTDPANWHSGPWLYSGWRGTVGRVAAYVGDTSPSYPMLAKVLAHYELSQEMTESAPDRINRLLSYLAEPPTALGPSPLGAYPPLTASAELSGALVGPQATAGVSLLAAVQEAWAGEGGRIWTWLLKGVAYGAGVVFGGRGGVHPVDPVLTLDVEADLSGQPGMTRDRDGQVAAVTASSRALSVTVRDDGLADLIGEQSASVSCALVDEAELLAFASARLAETAAVRMRLTSASVDVASATLTPNPAPTAFPSPVAWSLWGLLLRLVPGARVRITGLPAARLGYTTRDAYVLGATERHAAEGHTWDLVLAPADQPAEMRIEDTGDVYDRIPGAGLTLGGDIDADDLTVSVVFDDIGLTAAPADYPLDLDLFGERVTVASEPAGSISPQTLTLSARGVGGTIARPHDAGEPVDVWLSPSVGW